MIPEFENLVQSYICTMQASLCYQVGFGGAKYANELLHELCKCMVNCSGYSYFDKSMMKCKLGVTKETLDREIERFFKEVAYSISRTELSSVRKLYW